MFTGIVEEIGTVQEVRRGAHSAVLTVGAELVLTDAHVGDSIAVNGICLTVTRFDAHSFQADVMHETLDRSSLAQIRRGTHVNLERAMPANGRFGGHIVAGHVDGVGRITSIQHDDTSIWYTIKAPEHILRYIVEKGSITIDGISLTVARVDTGLFAISAIPHTTRVTILGERRVGDVVNLETDIIGKYVEKLMQPSEPAKEKPGITKEFLIQNGF